MSDEPSQSGGARWVLYAWVVVPVLLLSAVIVAILMQTVKGPPPPPPSKGGEANDLAVVRTTLTKQNDLATCKAAVSRLNAHLRQPGAHTVPEMPTADRDRLKSDLGLSDAAAAEVASTTFTALDAHHLETCFLLRDAAISLETTAPAGKGKVARMSPLERAEVGFAWVCRQIRLQKPELDPAPVAFALRRGWGRPIDRALAFLALVEQFGLQEDDAAGLQGCLVGVPAERGGSRLWACGVAVGAKPDALYLFDPRIGLPLPGPGGKGIATLAQAQADPKVLAQLDAGAVKYDVTAEDAKKAELQLVCPLSSAAPRMLVLQNVLLRERAWKDRPLPSAIRVRLAETPGVARATIQSAAKGVSVKFAPGLAHLLSDSLPKEEGGTDTPRKVDLTTLPGFGESRTEQVSLFSNQQLMHLTAVPWPFFPNRFRNIDEFGLNAGLGPYLRQMYQVTFLKAMNDPSGPREAILRGRIAQSTTESLMRERDLWVRGGGQQPDPDPEQLERWIQEANRAFAAVLRGGEGEVAAKEALGRVLRWRPGEPMEVLMAKAIGTPRAMEVTYQLGLCMHERGERAAARVSLASRSGQALPDEKKRAEEGHQAAANWWGILGGMAEEARRLATTPAQKVYAEAQLAAARRLHGEALWALGKKDEARAAWKDIPVVLSEVEKVAGPSLGR